ncbi:MAG TPA: PKD domain-containing protein [Flavipsychrobacter sp.]|nr:PKD domain-containing protein [Flavipsychrobacter sp.]
MNPIKLTLLLSFFLLLQAPFLNAQTLSADWAKQIYGSKGGTMRNKDIVTDKQGNIYALHYARGYVQAGGQTTPDSTATMVLTSWDCNGNLRWMNSLGAISSSVANNYGLYLETDTLGGIYVSGYCFSSNAPASYYWGTDTTINAGTGTRITYIAKYNTQGQFQWIRTPVINNMLHIGENFSVSSSGDVYWFALLDAGTYGGGAFTITTRKYYVVHYNAAGTYQAATPLDITPPVVSTITHPYWGFTHVANRFYCWTSYDTTYGNLVIGNTTIAPPTGYGGTVVLAAFSQQGQNIWVEQASTNTSSHIDDVAGRDDGVLYVRGASDTGTIFFGNTITNTLSQSRSVYLMAIDSNGGLLWSNSSANTHNLGIGNIYNIDYANNAIAISGRYYGTLSWDNLTLNYTGSGGSIYMLKVNAATGAAQQLENFSASNNCNITGTVLDKNGNVYINGYFQGNMTFGTTILIPPPIGISHGFLLKYKNIDCGCDLLQPSFNITATASSTFQCSYTGGTPYTSISWNFGDGSPAVSGSNPNHTYSSLGTFPVCVTVSDTCGSNTTCKYVTVNTTNVTDAESVFSMVKVYPVPAKEQIVVSNLPNGTTVEVLDVLGRSLRKIRTDYTETVIYIDDLTSGIHMLRFTHKDGQRGSRMFVKQ